MKNYPVCNELNLELYSISDEPLTSVLEDLQSLTTAVLKDDDDTGSESDS